MQLARPDYWAKAKITHTMADSRRADWESVLVPFKNEIKRVLEIGCYEGQSALFWYNFLRADITCVDKWEDVAKGCRNAQEVEEHFDANVLGLPVTKMKMASTSALIRLADENARFDLVYIDGDHSRLQVMIDSCLAWRLLPVGGVVIWDDHTDYRPDLIDRPASAIIAFVTMMREELRVIRDTGQQLIVRKV